MEQAEQVPVDRTRALYERPLPHVEDEATFREVRTAVEARFSQAGVRDFLRSLDKARIRIRDFAVVLEAGKLGSSTPQSYARLTPGDQGLIRELYLGLLEQVPEPLRDRFFRLYAYY